MAEEEKVEEKKEIDLTQYVHVDDVAGLKANHDKLLAEKKEAQRLTNDANLEAKRIKDEAAAKSGDVESLRKSWEEEKKLLTGQIEANKTEKADNAKSKAATNIAMGLAEGSNVKILGDIIAKRLRFDDNKVQVTDSNGNLTVSSLEDLTKEFANNVDYKSLLVGSKASGSGATKGNVGGAGKVTATRSEFDAMSQIKRSEFFKTGGKLAD